MSAIQTTESLAARIHTAFPLHNLVEQLISFSIDLFIAALIFTGFLLLWLLTRLVLSIAFKQIKGDATTAAFLHNTFKFLIFTIGAIAALDVLGVKTSSILTSLGIVGLTVGFAAKDALSNLISGILIFLDRPFVIGDLIEIDGRYGRVERITLRSTRIVTTDGKMLAVPNTEIVNRTVTSYSNYPHLRLDIPVNIAVTEKIADARLVLLALVENNHEFMDNPAPRVVVKELNDYNNQIELQVWIQNEYEHIAARFRLREAIFNALTEAGIEMPYETLRLVGLQQNIKES